MKVLSIALAAAWCAAALAQEAAPALPEDPRAPRYRELERGLFAGLEAGWVGYFKTPVAEASRYPSAGSGGGLGSGLHVAVQVGGDVTPRLALAALFLGQAPEASVSYGSFSVVGAGADARWTFLGLRDGQGVERIFLYAHARGAWFVTEPHGLFGTRDTLLGLGAGLEYYTRLRHFSVGLAADGLYALKAKAPAIALVPTLRYTF
jgi:hypothetical protein